MSFPFPLTVTVSAASVGTDEYGNTVPSAWSTSATVAGDVQPVRTDERDTGIDNVAVDEVRFYLAAGTVVGAGDRLTVNGVTYEAIGPADDRAYGGRLDYVRVRARRTL